MYITGITAPNAKPGVGHFAFGVTNFMENKAAMKAEMERRGLANIRADGEVGWSALDPAGYMLNTWVPIKDKSMYPGAAGPCEVANSDSCKREYEAGLKNLSSIPKASGKGFKATSYSHIVLTVPEGDFEKEKEFYTGMYGMKLIYEKKDPQSPEIFLRFGRNTLYLRKTAKPDDKPFCNHYAFVVDNYDQAKVETELKRRGLNAMIVDKGCVVNSLYNYSTHMTFFTTPELLEIGDIPMTSLNEKPVQADIVSGTVTLTFTLPRQAVSLLVLETRM